MRTHHGHLGFERSTQPRTECGRHGLQATVHDSPTPALTALRTIAELGGANGHAPALVQAVQHCDGALLAKLARSVRAIPVIRLPPPPSPRPGPHIAALEQPLMFFPFFQSGGNLLPRSLKTGGEGRGWRGWSCRLYFGFIRIRLQGEVPGAREAGSLLLRLGLAV